MLTKTIADHYPLVSVLDEHGAICGTLPDLSSEQWIGLYAWMVKARAFDQKMINLQRQGRVGTYAPFSGQEAAQIGSFAALDQRDWITTSYRELAGLMYHGLPIEQAMLVSMGHPDAGNMPGHLNIFPIQIIIAAQLLHAVGTAWASKLKGEGSISVTYFGDGATSEGDFHEALNLASVQQIPVIFFCQNNQWAISLPASKQMATPTIAQKATAYGIEGVRVDGNDVLAVYQVMKTAVQRARRGEGPTLIEAVTYRLGSHSTADDPTRYRDHAEWKEWKENRDPLNRYRTFLQHQGLWHEEMERDIQDQAKQEIEAAVVKAESLPKAVPTTVFDHVFETMPKRFVQQKEEMQRYM